jgi:hypothetical protein
MLVRSNPFHTGGPVAPARFVGRTNDIAQAFDRVAGAGHLALFGSSGMGKSSFLSYLGSSEKWIAYGLDPSHSVITRLDCQGIRPFTPHRFWKEALSLLQEGLEGDARAQAAARKAASQALIEKTHVREVLRALGRSGKRWVLLADDYDVVFQAHAAYGKSDIQNFLYEFRSLTQDPNAGPHLSTVVTTSRRLDELGPRISTGSPWYNHHVFRLLKPYADAEIRALFGLMPLDLAFTEAQCHAIRRVAGRNPALLQCCCELLYENRVEQAPFDPPAFGLEFLSRSEAYFRNAWETASDTEQMLLMLIALARLDGRLRREKSYDLRGIDSIFSQLDRELRDLVDRGILEPEAADGVPDLSPYRFGSSLLEWWVIKELENARDEGELAQRQRVLLHLSRKQVDQLKTAMQWVWSHKEAAKAVVNWFGSLVGAFAGGVVGGARGSQ